MKVTNNKLLRLLRNYAERLFLSFIITLLLISCQSNKLNKQIIVEIPLSLKNDAMRLIVDSLDKKNNEGEFASSEYKTKIMLDVKGWVNDYDSVLTDEEVKQLNKKISDFESLTTIEIAIVIIPKDWVNPLKFDEYITKMGNQWGVGKKETNNGIVIGICKGLKKIRISTGFGIEKILPDADVKKIIDQHFIPFFKEGDYYTGCINGLDAMFERLR
jgi:uncharacterized protein